MVDVKDLSVEELQAELKKKLEQKKLEEIPQLLKKINWEPVITEAISRRDSVVNGDYHEDNDDAHYLFETVMEAVFGKYYFDWENEETK